MAFRRFSSGLVTLCLAIILPCLALSSILEMGLKNSAPKRPANWNGLSKREYISDEWWPKKMLPDETGLLNASAALALLTTFMMAILAVIAKRKGTVGTTKVRLAVLGILGLSLFLAIAAFLFSFIQSGVSSRVDGDYVVDNMKGDVLPDYEKGKFSYDIWACGCVDYIREDLRGKMEKACAMHLGARWLTFTTFLFSAGLFIVAFFDSRREGHILYAV